MVDALRKESKIVSASWRTTSLCFRRAMNFDPEQPWWEYNSDTNLHQRIRKVKKLSMGVKQLPCISRNENVKYKSK